MKNKNLFTTCLSLLLACLLSTSILGQEAVVGSLKNGNAVLTSLTNATAVLKGGLPDGSIVSDVYIDQQPSTGKYFLIGTIKNGGVSGKAIELQSKGGQLKAVGGPGLEVTCTGINCSSCLPNVKEWKVRCECQDNPAQPNASCDMTTKLIISVW